MTSFCCAVLDDMAFVTIWMALQVCFIRGIGHVLNAPADEKPLNVEMAAEPLLRPG
jgi:Na+-transporting methylmalonyl-CoA/oxaloacetate decarboxylase gamma subunit